MRIWDDVKLACQIVWKAVKREFKRLGKKKKLV